MQLSQKMNSWILKGVLLMIFLIMAVGRITASPIVNEDQRLNKFR